MKRRSSNTLAVMLSAIMLILMSAPAFAQTSRGTVTGAVITRNIQDTSITAIDTGVSGNKAVNFNCSNVRHGGGDVMDSILNSVPAGWFLKAGTYREVTD